MFSVLNVPDFLLAFRRYILALLLFYLSETSFKGNHQNKKGFYVNTWILGLWSLINQAYPPPYFLKISQRKTR